MDMLVWLEPHRVGVTPPCFCRGVLILPSVNICGIRNEVVFWVISSYTSS